MPALIRHARKAREWAARTWSNINTRAGAKHNHRKCYKDVEVRMSRAEFFRWVMENYGKWVDANPGKKPSIDRKDPMKHYEIGNIEIVDLDFNRTHTTQNKNFDAPEGKLFCPDCQDYLESGQFYEIASRQGRNHWSAYCKVHTRQRKIVAKQEGSHEHPNDQRERGDRGSRRPRPHRLPRKV